MKRRIILALIAAATLLLPGAVAQAQTAFRHRLSQEPAWGHFKQYTRQQAPQLKGKPSLPFLNVTTLTPKRNATSLQATHRPGMPVRLPKAGKAAQPRLLATTASGTHLWGNVIYRDDWEEYAADYGLYSFSVDGDQISTGPLFTDYELYANGGGAFLDDVFHCVQYDVDPWGGLYAFYFKYDTYNWLRINQEGIDISGQWELIARCTAVDPTTNTVYGVFSTFDGTGLEFGTIDYSDLSRTTIASVDIETIAMACDSHGQLYAISQEGDLYRIDKSNGAYSLVGATGFQPEAYLQSATFDLQDDHLYWAALRGDQSVLLDVDTSTGKASKVADFPHFEEVICLYAPFVPADEAPMAVSGLAADFAEGSLTGNVCFVLPEQTVSGQPLTGPLGYEVLVDGVSMATGQGQPGESISQELTLTQGTHKIKVAASNEAGQGAQVFITEWIGPDTPTSVEDLQLTYDAASGTATLTWNNPEKGVNGGYIDTEKLTVNITRHPDEAVVAEHYKGNTFSEVLQPSELTAYSYSVTLCYDGQEAEPSVSNHIIVGEALTLPYCQYFDTDDALDLFTVIDANGNGNTWTEDTWEGAASYVDGWADIDGDDWLITPPVKMQNDRQYIISFKVRNIWEWYNEVFATALGQGEDPAQYTEVIPQTFITSDKFQTFSNVVTVPENGDYRYAIHAISYAGSYGFLLDSLTIKEGAKFTAPDSVTALTVTPGAMGAKRATLSFTTPAQTAGGEALTGLTAVVVTADGSEEPLATLNDVSPNSTYTIEVEGLEGDGWHTFTVAAYNNGADRGVENNCEAWIGFDVPEAPTDVHLADNLDGTSQLTWTAPGTTGLHGGYVDPTQLTYNVYSIVGYEMMEPVEMGIEGTSYQGELPQTGEQQLIEWAVAACSAGGEGATTPANTLFSGEPYTLPFHESFADGTTEMPIWGATESEDGWCVFYPQRGFSADGDNGCITFSPFAENETCTFYSGKITLEGTAHPLLSFSYYAVPGLLDKVGVYARTPDGQRLFLDETDFYSLEGEEGWRRMGVDLSPLRQYAYINVDFEGFAGDVMSPIYFDNINIRDAAEHDVLVKMEATPTITAGQELTAQVNVENIGYAPTGATTVDFYVADELAESVVCDDVDYLTDKTFTFVYRSAINAPDVLPVKAVVTLADGKQYATEPIDVTVNQPGFTSIDNLTATAVNEGVQLQWSLPQYVGEKQTESFESYEPFSIGGVDGTFGDWKTIDGDKEYTAGFTHISYDHLFDPKAFIIFRPQEFWQLMYPQLTPTDGIQYIAAFSPESVNADDWLISPALSGSAQTVSMMVRSYTENTGLEDFEIRYSTEGSDTADFKTVVYQGQAPLDWTQVEVQLPEGATHFAIHYTSKTKVMFMLDAVTFEKGDQTVTGFQIYRDGKLIDLTGAETMQYVDCNAEEGTHTYNVTVIYASGESSFSNDATILVTGIEDTAVRGAMVQAQPGFIHIAHAAGMRIEVFTNSGACVYRGMGTEALQKVQVKAGNYLVRVGEKVFNVLVER